MLATRLYSPIALPRCEVLRVPRLSVYLKTLVTVIFSGQTDFYNLDVVQIYVGHSHFCCKDSSMLRLYVPVLV